MSGMNRKTKGQKQVTSAADTIVKPKPQGTQLNVTIPDQMKEKLQILAIQRRVHLRELVHDIFKEYLNNHQDSEPVDRLEF